MCEKREMKCSSCELTVACFFSVGFVVGGDCCLGVCVGFVVVVG